MKNNIKNYIFILFMFLIMCPIKVFGATGTILPSTGGNLTSGTYYLNSNTKLSKYIIIPAENDVTINLNGYVLTGDGTERVISNSGTLRIIDEVDTKRYHYGSLTSIERIINRNNRSELYVAGYEYEDGKAWEVEILDDVLWKYEGTTTNLSQVPTGKISVEGGCITGGYSSNGAAIYNNGGTLYLDGGTLIGNHAYRTTNTSLSSPVSNGNGGAVFNTNEGTFEMTGGCISYNCGDGTGGGVCVRSGVFEMKSGIIEYNDTTASGGGVNTQGSGLRPVFIFGADLNETNWQKKYETDSSSIPIIRYNKTRDTRNTGNGGGIHVQSGTLTYNAGKIQNNNTTGSGAGIYAYIGSNVQAQSEYCIIEDNYAQNSGGGISQQYGTVSLTNSIIRNNSARAGGGISVRVGNFEMTNGIISSNIARTGDGGGISASAQNNISPHADEGNLGCEVKIRGGTFMDNEATNGNGGGIYISVKNSTEECNVDIVGGKFIDNIAGKNGGGIYLEGGNLNINEESGLETVISGNKSGQYGGAAYIAEMINNTCYEKNEEKYATKAETDTNPIGYSEYFQKITPGYVEITGGSIDNNSATKDGGAIYIKGGSFVLSGTGEIKNCTAVNGGAVYILGGNATIDGGTVEECIATEKGGAIYLSNGDFVFEDGNIGRIEDDKKFGCKAIQGGAVYVIGGSFTMNGGTIEGNTATESGGGIQISDGNVYITGGKILSNVARGEANEKSSDVGYGGGIFVDGGDKVEITGGEISNNVAAKNGGGIEIKTDKAVTVDIYSGIFNKNVAEQYGGAIGIDCSNGIVNIGEENCDGSNLSTHEHPQMSENIAGVNGGGFYVSGTDCNVNIYCGIVDNNITVDIENNFTQISGTINVYKGVNAGGEEEGVIIVGGTFYDERKETTEYCEITYYKNYEGSLENRKALVSKGSKITLPKDIFSVEGYDIISWTKDKDNTTIPEYDVGQILEITENIDLYALWILEGENLASFIVYIPSEIILDMESTALKFDVEATLTAFSRNQMLRIVLLENDFELKLKDDEMEVATLAYKIKMDNEELSGGEIIADIYSDSSLITYNKKEELEIEVLDIPIYAGNYEDTFTFYVSVENVE